MTGLSTSDARARLAQVGPNALPERAPDPVWRRFIRQFQSPLIYILLFALVFDAGLWIYEGAQAATSCPGSQPGQGMRTRSRSV